ncbi:serine hydrolase domain-containing protein [Ponticaulis profundi]|uniref:Serine hydrolase domain-containing protein n=1 Tax=Ponticaulis profundi TaxID=2665222 RepID=A0ABW1S4Q7_9PROT
MLRLHFLLPGLAPLLFACAAEDPPQIEASPAPDISEAVEPETEAVDTSGPLMTRAQMEGLLQTIDVPGMATATITSCEVTDVSTAGLAIVEPAMPVTPDTAFEAASLSKPVFAWLVMSLVDDSVIDLDEPFAETFEYPRITDAENYAKLTPRLVLTHRTGLPNWVDETTDFWDRTAEIPFNTPPGDAFSYSGEGFQLLQIFIEQKTGKRLQQIFEERLGGVMANSTFAQPLPDTVIASRGYGSASDEESGRDMDNLYPRAVSAGSLVTTPGDLGAFLAMVCRREGLSAASYEDMLTPQSPAPGGPDMPSSSWSLGWMNADMGEVTFIGHNGNNDEYKSFGGFLKETGDGLVILTNGARGDELIGQIIGYTSPE